MRVGRWRPIVVVNAVHEVTGLTFDLDLILDSLDRMDAPDLGRRGEPHRGSGPRGASGGPRAGRCNRRDRRRSAHPHRFPARQHPPEARRTARTVMQVTPLRVTRGTRPLADIRYPAATLTPVSRASLAGRVPTPRAPITASTSPPMDPCHTCRTHPAVLDGLCGRCWVADQDDGEARPGHLLARQRHHLTSC